ncbi:HAMP domain-containing histidine kinase [Lachnoclostridium pacaense]|uniref:sensor histidine kinase n=1 Tax=Enterocloster hominis (ex Hitch et al. 2024) TaxID=1917870 RepID=UPI001D109222|nr:HAMP domain-containing sensor histidine kinase [Lachnoclostridium pacaense]MCC2816930.1 HAMP domain-containing histidine kinase [Lachnoclostridium pacaense]
MLIGKSAGLPGEFILLFTILIWLLFFLVYLGNRHSQLNRWCFISGMCFSVGVLKEYLYFTLFPVLCREYPWLMNGNLSLTIYSILTAVMYYYAMPSAIIFAFYFSSFNQRYPRYFSWLRICIFIPAILFGIRYPYMQTRHYQLYDYIYYLTAAIYNWLYGIIFTLLILNTLKRERKSEVYEQKRLVAFLCLIPIWYELLSAFLVHVLRIKPLFKLWQGNLVIIFLLIIYYLYHAFNGGIMGARFMHQTYDWDKEGRLINKSAHFIRHVVKNEIAKIEWGASSIEASDFTDKNEILNLTQIIARSARHLDDYMSKINDYSEDIKLEPSMVSVPSLIEDCIHDFRSLKSDISFDLNLPPDSGLFCDYKHIHEVMTNLLNNAFEAIGESGTITIGFQPHPKQNLVCLYISDTGSGIPAGQLPKLFTPYYTTKTTNHHMGLGLYYCRNVMLKHKGSIQVESKEGAGTTFTLCFPFKYRPQDKRR